MTDSGLFTWAKDMQILYRLISSTHIFGNIAKDMHWTFLWYRMQ